MVHALARCSHVFRATAAELGLEPRFTRPRRPQTNGKVGPTQLKGVPSISRVKNLAGNYNNPADPASRDGSCGVRRS